MKDDKYLAKIAELTPRKIVEELNKYIVGQLEAKKAVAIALRNRYRRQLIPEELREEVTPKNIIMIGPTGVGKTEIARRLAQLVKAPFIKVEATKYTEIGYYGRDVESMIRDLVNVSINMVRAQALKEIEKKVDEIVEEKILELLFPNHKKRLEDLIKDEEKKARTAKIKESLRSKLRAGELDNKIVELKVEETSIAFMQAFTPAGLEEVGLDLQDAFGNLFKPRIKTKKMSVREAKAVIKMKEADKLLDKDKIIKEGLSLAENHGIVFIDEIDKIVSSGKMYGPDISREGVQRDLLPIVEGTTVHTRYGSINTSHILFIAAGAFHTHKPTDLIPELQGRFPIRVELSSLGKSDFIKILTEPKNALIKQYKALLETEGITLDFTGDAIEEIASFTEQANTVMQNIGARRLYTVMEKLIEDISFNAPENVPKNITIDKEFVRKALVSIIEKEDLRKYML